MSRRETCICEMPTASAIWVCVWLPKKRSKRIVRSRSVSSSSSGSSASRYSTWSSSASGLAQPVGQRGVVRRGQLVHRTGAVGLLGLQAGHHIFHRDVEPLRDLARPGRPAELLGQRADDAGQLALQVLEPARDPGGPGVVAEVAPDLAGDRRDGEGEEVDAAVGVEPVHGADQTDGAGLFEVLERLAAAAEPPGDVLNDGQMTGDQLVAQHLPVRVIGRQPAYSARAGARWA